VKTFQHNMQHGTHLIDKSTNYWQLFNRPMTLQHITVTLWAISA